MKDEYMKSNKFVSYKDSDDDDYGDEGRDSMGMQNITGSIASKANQNRKSSASANRYSNGSGRISGGGKQKDPFEGRDTLGASDEGVIKNRVSDVVEDPFEEALQETIKMKSNQQILQDESEKILIEEQKRLQEEADLAEAKAQKEAEEAEAARL